MNVESQTVPGPGANGAGPDEPPVRLTVPAAPRYLRLARLTAAGIASDLGFTIEEIEDLRVAVDEVCAVLIETATDHAVLELEYRTDGRGLVVVGRCESVTDTPPELHAVARELLGMTADAYQVDIAEGRRVFELRKAPGVGP